MIALYGADAGRASYEQEYMCSFTAAILGAFYALEMTEVRNEGRVLDIEPDLDRPVHRAWDLGVRDDTAIWWYQARGGQLLILDVMAGSASASSTSATKFFKRHEERGWIHGDDYVPHDAKIKEWGSGRTRVETMQSHGAQPRSWCRWPVSRMALMPCDEPCPYACFTRDASPGLAALEQYQREWDDDKKAFKLNPLHNWTSHYADAFRYLAQGWKPAPETGYQGHPTGWLYAPTAAYHATTRD